ncbi:MAG: hypothetical protein KQH83_11540 [Actinobacteria bacterium]|nr:hypothetical protein [Actinomycetota bacterium]
MLWLITQIAVFLVIAFVLGILIGWLLCSLWPSRRSRIRESELQAALARATARINDLEAGLQSKRVAAAAAAEQEEAARRRVEELEAGLASLESHGDADTAEMERLQAELDEALGSISTLRREVAGLQAGSQSVDQLRDERDRAVRRIAELEASLAESASAPAQAGLFDTGDGDDETTTEAAPALQLVPEPDGGGGGGAPEDDAPEDVSADEPARDEAPDAFAWGRPAGSADAEAPAALDADDAEGAEEPAGEEAPEPFDPEVEEALRREAVASVTERFRPSAAEDPDDLTRIYGIGPVLQRTLHEMHITTFRQIAEFTDDDIDLVSRALGRAFPDRVRRDDWKGGAAEILRQEQEDGW